MNTWQPWQVRTQRKSMICREFNQKSQPVRNKTNRENTHQRKIITRIRQYLRGSAICLRPRSCRDFTIIREKIQQCTRTLSRNPNPNYTLALSHRKKKIRIEADCLSFLYFLSCGLLTRLIGIFLKSILFNLAAYNKAHIYIYMLLYKSRLSGIPFSTCIRSILWPDWAWLGLMGLW